VAMKKVFNYLKENVRSDQRVWVRGSPYGHAKCSQYTAPSTIAVKPTGQPGEYEWDMLEKFDIVWKVKAYFWLPLCG
jgi:DNA polymerase phi